MTEVDPPSQQRPVASADAEVPPSSSAVARADRMSAGNMIRSLVPLVLICLAVVGWISFRQGEVDPIREIDPTSAVRAATERADYLVVAPLDLPDGYVPSDADISGEAGGPVTLGIDLVTPSVEYAGFLISDDPEADAVHRVLDGAEPMGTVEIDGQVWTRSTTQRGEIAFSREDAGVTVLVTGSASEEELTAVVGALRAYSA